MSTEALPQAPARRGLGSAWMPLGLIGLGLLAMYLPTYAEMAKVVWSTDEQGHGPIIFAASLWLLYRRREAILALPSTPPSAAAWCLFALGLALYWLGQSQEVLMFSMASQILVIAALLWLFKGAAAVRLAAFPLFFLLFMIPLPGPLVAAVTAPLKAAVSTVAAGLLYALGYPVGRSGVVLQVGQYQMLVADACAGLNSMFTLEALGLLYMNLRGHTQVARNVAMALLLIPVAFCANVIRVLILVLVTFHFGDAAGQGFVHGFAGMVLFVVALALMMAVDRLLGWVMRDPKPQ